MPTLVYTKSGGNFTYVTTSGTSTISNPTDIRYTETDNNGSWIRVHIPVPAGHTYTITQIYTEYTSAVGTTSTKGEFQYGLVKEKRDTYNYDKNSSFTYTVARGTYGSSAGNTYTASTSLSLDSGDWYLYVFVVKSGYAFQYITASNTKLQLTYTDTALPTYTISYDANGGTGAPASQTKTEDVTLTLSSTKPTKANSTKVVSGSFTIIGNANGGYFGNTSTKTTSITGTSSRTDTISYTFSKWNTNKDGTGTSYNAGATYTTNASATLYAQYTTSTSEGTTSYSNNLVSSLATPQKASTTPATYTITYNVHGGSTVANGSASTTRKYTFKGWATTENATSANAAASYNSDTTLYAFWTSSDTYGTITLPTPTKTGYTFMGWATSETASSGLAGGSKVEVKSNITYHAIWKANDSNAAVCIYIDGQGYRMAQVYLFTTSDNKWHLATPYLYDGSWHISS